MKKSNLLLLFLCLFFAMNCNAQSKSLKLVFIRHGEKSEDGNNLNCQGLNRSLLLPAVLYKKFGRPANVYVPSLKLGGVTKHARMLQTATPFLVKYNLTVNTSFDADDDKGTAKALLKEDGTIIIIWEHKNIPAIIKAMGVDASHLKWPDDDFDSIWIVTFHKGNAMLQKDSEGLKPEAGCPF